MTRPEGKRKMKWWTLFYRCRGAVEKRRTEREERERERFALAFILFYFFYLFVVFGFRWLHFRWDESPRAAVTDTSLTSVCRRQLLTAGGRSVNCWAVSSLCVRTRKVYKPQTSCLWTVLTLAAVCSLCRRKAYLPQKSCLCTILTLIAVCT